jgi:hypothetical protein
MEGRLKFKADLEEIARMISGLIHAAERRDKSTQK